MSERLMKVRILWVAVIGAIGLFAFVLIFLLSKGALDMSQTASPLTLLILGVVAVGQAVASWVIPRRIYRQALALEKMPTKEETDPNVAGMYRDSAPMVRVFVFPKQACARASVLFQTPFIIGAGLCELIAIYGLALGYMGFGLTQALLFMAAGAFLVAIRFPLERHITAPLQEVYQAQLLD